MGLFKKGNLTKLKKKASEAAKDVTTAGMALGPVLLEYKKWSRDYNSWRQKQTDAITDMGEDKYYSLMDGRIQPTPQDLSAIKEILKISDKVMEYGDQVVPMTTKKDNAVKAYNDAVARLELINGQIEAYLKDKEVMKSMGKTEYKQWKDAMKQKITTL